jgi:diguanylate cyclase (GGDEF)-like protein
MISPRAGVSVNEAIFLMTDPVLLDVLVSLKNRRAYEIDLPRLVASSSGAEPLALLRIDVDFFKKVNDEQGGHAVGDEALRAVAQLTEICVRGKGEAYRVGGDEFAVLLPNHTIDEATAVAERIRRTLNETPVTSRKLTLSLSIGVAVYPVHAADFEALGRAADSASYDAKNLGRNLVRIFGEPPPSSARPARKVERKEPDPGGLTGAQRDEILDDYFGHRRATCPFDGAVLRVHDVTNLRDKIGRILIHCPRCGLDTRLP